MPGRATAFANQEFYHLFNRGVERRPTFTNKHEFKRATDLVSFYRFDKPALRYSKYLALEAKQRVNFLSSLKEKAVEIIALFCF